MTAAQNLRRIIKEIEVRVKIVYPNLPVHKKVVRVNVFFEN